MACHSPCRCAPLPYLPVPEEARRAGTGRDAGVRRIRRCGTGAHPFRSLDQPVPGLPIACPPAPTLRRNTAAQRGRCGGEYRWDYRAIPHSRPSWHPSTVRLGIALVDSLGTRERENSPTEPLGLELVTNRKPQKHKLEALRLSRF